MFADHAALMLERLRKEIFANLDVGERAALAFCATPMIILASPRAGDGISCHAFFI